jgi:hypothetical protein
MRRGRALTVLLAALAALALGGATTAGAQTIDVRRATQLTRDQAQTLGSVTWAVCWRKSAAIHARLRDRAVCTASVQTASSETCLVIYEIRMTPTRARALAVSQTGTPRCVNQTAGVPSG